MPSVSPSPFLPFSPPKERSGSRRFALEGLEPRWLLSATPAAAALQAAWPAPEQDRLWQEAAAPKLSAEPTLASAGQLDLSQAAPAGAWSVGPLPDAGSATALMLIGADSTNALQGRLAQVYAQARLAVQDFLSAHSAQELQALLPGDASQPNAWGQTEAVRQQWLAGAGEVTLTLASGEQMAGAMAAFTANGPSGGAEVFVNRQWLTGLGTDPELLRVLVEELGHGLDAALNGERDSPGDEGELFAAHVLALPLEPAQRQRIALEDDHALLWWGLSSYAVEQATLTGTQSIATGLIQDADIDINGVTTLTSTESSTGRLGIGVDGFSTLDGNGDSTADHLTLRAQGVVKIFGTIGGADPLESLTIGGVTSNLPNAVIFDKDVTLAGPLTIDTEGIVTFSGKLTITGGNLVIRGATLIEFKDIVNINGGNILLEGDEIDVLDSGRLQSTGGVLEMRSKTLGLGMEVAGPSGEISTPLNLSLFELSRIEDGGFSKIVLGHYTGSGANAHAAAGQGSVRIGGIQSVNQFTFHAPLEVHAGSVRIEDINIAAQPPLAVKGTVKLDATGDIAIGNRLLASTDLSQTSAYQDITLYSSAGKVTQFNDTRTSLGDGLSSEAIQGKRLTVQAHQGIELFATEVTDMVLINTGTNAAVEATSSTSLSLGTGAKTLATATGGAWTAGDWVSLISSSNAATRMYGQVSAYNSGTGALIVDVFEHAGLGSVSSWRVVSNADIRIVETASGEALTILQAQQTGTGATGGIYIQTLSSSSDTPGDLVITPTAAGLLSTPAGSIGLRAGSALTLGLNADMSSIAGTVELVAGGAISMVTTGGARTERSISASGDVFLQAGGDIALGSITSAADVALIAAGSVLDGDALSDVSASGLYVAAGSSGAIGSGTDALEISVANLALSTGSGGAFISEASGISVAAVTVAVNQSHASNRSTQLATAQTWSDAVSASNGSIVLSTSAGSIVLDDGADADGFAVSANGTGNILIRALGSGTDITANADIVSGSGNVSVLAARSVSLTGTADIRTTSAAATGGSIDVQAGTGSITQSATSLILSTGASATARLLGATDVTLGDIELIDGKVSITATAGSILDADALVSGGNDPNQNITASALRLNAGMALADSVNHLETTVATLSARAGNGGIFVLEADALSVDDVAVSVNRVGSDGATLTTTSDATQSDVRTTGGNGAIVLSTTAGSITLGNGTAPADDTAVSADGSGSILIQAGVAAGNTTSDVTASADIVSGRGNISVIAARSVSFTGTADIRTTSTAATSGSIDVAAGTGSITQSANSVLISTGASATARLLAATDVTVGDINLADGRVSITATAGSILDANALVSGANDAGQDITAAALRLNAGTAVGQSVNHLETTVATLSARAGNGGIFVLEADALSVDDVAVSVNRVGSDGATLTTTSDATQSDVRTTGGNGAIVLRTTAGSITLGNGTAPADDTAVSADGSGSILIQAGVTAGNTTSDIAASADIVSGSGNISVIAARSVSLTGTADIRTTSAAATGGSIDVQAGTGSITQSATSLILSTGASATARLLAATDVTVGDIELIDGQVSITATAGSILDADALVSGGNDPNQNITASALRLNAGMALADSVNHLETTVATLSARAGNGGIFVLEADALSVDDVAVSVNRVGSDGATLTTTSDATQSDVRTTGGNGAIVLSTTAGSITLGNGTAPADDTAVSADGSGSILIQAGVAAGNTTSDVTASADIVSGRGNISVIAARSVSFTGTADIRTTSTAATSGSIDVAAGTGSITQSANSVLISTGASATARLLAATDVTVGDINLADGRVSITATAGSILDANALVSGANDAGQDITAAALRLNAGTAVGQSVNHLETTVATLSARAGNGGIFVLEADALSVDDVAVSVNRVGSDGATLTTTSDATQSDVRTTGGNGAIVLRTTAGSITLGNGTAPADDTAVSADGSGSILIQAGVTAGNTTSDIAASADIVSGSGNISVIAARSVSLTGTADIRTTSAAATGGSIDVQAGTGSITQSATSLILSTGASATARLLAATDVTVGDIELIDGQVSITATAGSILDADALVSGGNDPNQNITASALRLNAGMALADSVNHLETTVATLSARAGNGGIFVLEADALSVDDVAVSVNRVGSDGATLTTTSDATQSDVRTTGGNGAIVLSTTAGSITLGNGTAPADDTAVSAHGSGNILISALAANADITAQADILSASGNISLLAARSVSLTGTADIRTSSTAAQAGSIDIQAFAGAIVQSASSRIAIESAGSTGEAMLVAHQNITVGDIEVAGSVSIGTDNGGGQILDADALLSGGANDADLDVTALSLRLIAEGSAGEAANPLETSVGKLTARALGGIYLLEADDVSIDAVAVTVNRVDSNGQIGGAVTHSASKNLRTKILNTGAGSDGHIVLRSTAGSITLIGDDNNDAVIAHGAGNVLLQTLGANTDIVVKADIVSTSGNISLLAARNVSFEVLAPFASTAQTGIQTGSTGATSGAIDIVAGTGSITQDHRSKLLSTGAQAQARLWAAQGATVGDLEVAGRVSITAGAAGIVDADALVSDADDADVDVLTGQLRLSASGAIGGAANHLETAVGVLSARAAAAGLFILEADDLSIGDTDVMVSRVKADGTVSASTVSDATQSDVATTGSNGAIVLRTTAGSITLGNGTAPGAATTPADDVAVSAHGSGNILIQALGAGTDITAHADISSGSGNISVIAARSVSMTGAADVRTTSAAATSGSIDVQAGTGSITQSATGLIVSTGASATARLLAATDVTVGDIELSLGTVSITATAGNILDADALVSGGNDPNQDITASALRLSAGAAIADSVNHLETTVATLSALAAGGGIYLLEADDLTVGSVSVSLNRVGTAAAASAVSESAQTDLRTSGGDGAIVLRSTAGNLTLSDGNADGVAISANGTGNVLLQALGASKSITVNADVASSAGNLSLLAGLDLNLGANADLLITGATPGAASVDAEAGAGALLMSASSTISSSGAGATARLKAATSVTVGDVSLASGSVSIMAGTSILDADALVSSANDGDQDITAVSLRLNAGTVVADSVNHLETTAGTLSAAAGGSVFLLEADDLIIGNVAVSVNRVGTAAAGTAVSDAVQADVRTTGNNGAIVLRSTAGSLTLNDGNTDGVAISAHGSGNVLLQAQGTGSNLAMNAGVQSGTGHISLKAADLLNVSANVKTASAGTVSLAAGGALTQSGSSTIEATGGRLRLSAGQDLTVGNLVASQVSLVSTGGAVTNADGSSKNVTATVLRIEADDAVGSSARSLSTSVRTLSVASTGSQSAGVFLTEDQGLSLGSVSVSVTEVTAAGAAAPQATSDAAQSSVIAGGNSDVRLQLLAGDLALADANQILKATRLLLQLDAGSAGVNTPQKQNLLGSVIDSKVNAAVDTVAELQMLADAVAAVLAAVVGGPGPSVAQLHALGVTGVTPKNLSAVHQALRATAEDGSGADSLSELQALVTQAQLVQPPVSLTQLAAIMQAAEDNNATEGKPSLSDYSQAAGSGAAGVLRVTAANIAAINSALNTAGVGRAQVDTVAKVQALVDAYSRVLAAADAVDNDTAKPSLADYAALGIAGIDSAAKVSLLGDVVDITARTDADTAVELQALADAVSAVLAGVSVANQLPSLPQLQALGLTGLSPANLAAVQLAIQNTSDDGLGADTLPKLQALVTALAANTNTLTGAAQDNSATETNPSLATFTQAGVTGVTTANLAAINNALNSASVDAAAVDTTAEVQALVNAYRAILSTADGAASVSTKPSRAQYEALGLSGLSAPIVALDVGTLALRVQPSGAGSAFMSNRGALNVATVLGVAGAQVGGDWVLTSGTTAGGLSVQSNVSVGGALRLDSGGSLSVQADVQSQGGLSLVAAGAISSAAGADLLTQTGDAYLRAGTAIDLAGDVSSTQGSAWLQAGTELALETLNAANGKAVLLAGGSIMGKTALVDLRADALLAQAGQGIGSVANPLRLSVSDLSLSAGAGGASLVHKDEGVRVVGVTVTSLQNQTVQVVNASATSSPVVRSQSGITVTGSGSLVLSADSDLTISQALIVGQDISLTADGVTVGATTTAGNDISVSASLIAVTAATTAGDYLSLVADLISVGAAALAGGDVSLRAASALGVTALGRVQSGSTANLYMGASAGSVTLSAGSRVNAGSGGATLTASQDVNLRGDVVAASTLEVLAGRDIGMSTGTGVGRTQGNITATGNVRLEALRALGLGSIDASAASVALKAGTTLSDGDSDDAAPQVDVRALAVSVQTGADAGSALDRIDLAAGTLALRTSAGSAFVNESNAVSVAAFTVPLQRILANGSAQAHPDASTVFDGLALQGNLVLALAAGDLTLGGQGLQASDSAELRVVGAVLDGDLSSDTVDITAATLTVIASQVGTADQPLDTALGTLIATLGSGGANLVETDALLLSSLSSSGAVNLTTTAAGANLSIASLSAAGQTVSLSSQGAVLDGDSGSDNLDITAAALTVSATGLGTSASRLETSLDSLSTNVGAGGAHLVETDALLVSNLRSSGTVNLTTTAAGSDLSVASLSAAGQTVNLSSQGSVLDADSGTDDMDITAASLNVTATGLGTASSALETSLTRLSGTLGSGGVSLADADALTISALSSGGAVALAAGGDLSLVSLNAGAQAVSLTVQGSVLDGDSANAGVKLSAGQLSVVAQRMGSQSSPLKTSVDSLIANMGEGGGLYLKDTDTVELISASGTGPVSVQAPAGNFSTTEARVLSSPLTLQSKDVDIGADLSGPRLDVVGPILDGQTAPLPLVLGSLVENVTPDNGVHIDSAEVGRLNFGTIKLGSGQAGQEIWFQTDPQNTADRLVFRSPVEVDTLSSTRLSGLIQGTGLQIKGPGNTTTLYRADVVQSRDVLINDRVVVEQSSIIEVIEAVGGTLTINGGITVKAGQTLQLLADAINFGPYQETGQAVSITLEDGATLVLGANQVSWSEGKVVFDSDGGQVVLRGAPSSLLDLKVNAADAKPKAFEPSAQNLERLLSWMAADQDGDDGLLSLTLGDHQAKTRIPSAFPWTDLGAGSVQLRGSEVHLGTAGGAPWSLSATEVLRATAGSVYLHVDLMAQDSVTLVSTAGTVEMDAEVKIAANGAVALSAAQGIVVGQIDSDARIDLYSPAGQITAAAGAVGPHLSAPAVSVYGYGQTSRSADAQRVLTVEALAVQVSAPSGVALRGMSPDGVIYRVMDRGVSYLQFKLMEGATERVLVATDQVQSELGRISAGQTPAQAWQVAGSATGLAAWVPSVAPSTPAVSRYLGEGPAVTPLMSMRAMASAPDDLLSDMSYGLSTEQEQPSLSLELGSPLLRSTGQLLTESEWTLLAR
jgi:hypothetical protein